MFDNDRITPSQLWVFIVLTVTGVGLSSLPRQVAEVSGEDGWITTILGGLITLLDFYVISILARRFPRDNLTGIMRRTLGKIPAAVLSAVFWLYMLLLVSMTLRIFGEVIKMSLLRSTPIEVIMITLLLAALILARGGIEPIVRFDEATVPIVLITIVSVTLLALKGSDFTNLLPVLRTPPWKILYGTFQTSYSYLGFELVLLIIPYIQKPKEMFKSGIIAFSIVIFVYTFIVMLTFARFGVEDTKRLLWPINIMIRSVEASGFFVEKLEAVMITLWVLFAFTTIVAYIYGVGAVQSMVFRQSETKHFCTASIPLIYFAAMFPDNIAETYAHIDATVGCIGIVSVYVIPVLLLIVSSIRKTGA